MLNIDDCDLFDMNEPRQSGAGDNNDLHNDDDFYYDRDSDDEEYEPRRHERVFRDEDDDNDDEDDDEDEDDTEANKRRHHLHRTQLIMEASSDDNANVHSVDNMKFTCFDSAPWGTKTSSFGGQSNDFGATSFFPEEANFQVNLLDPAVTAVFDPIDPFATSFGNTVGNNVSSSFGFETSAAFGDFDAVFGSSRSTFTQPDAGDAEFSVSLEADDINVASPSKLNEKPDLNDFGSVSTGVWPDKGPALQTSELLDEQPIKVNTDGAINSDSEASKDPAAQIPTVLKKSPLANGSEEPTNDAKL